MKAKYMLNDEEITILLSHVSDVIRVAITTRKGVALVGDDTTIGKYVEKSPDNTLLGWKREFFIKSTYDTELEAMNEIASHITKAISIRNTSSNRVNVVILGI